MVLPIHLLPPRRKIQRLLEADQYKDFIRAASFNVPHPSHSKLYIYTMQSLARRELTLCERTLQIIVLRINRAKQVVLKTQLHAVSEYLFSLNTTFPST
jgi:hypothetical protein